MNLTIVVECCGNYGQDAINFLNLGVPDSRILNQIARARAVLVSLAGGLAEGKPSGVFGTSG
jgi:hypothetical protein